MNLFNFIWSQGKPFPLKQILITIRGMSKICFSFSHLFKQKKNGCLRELFLCEYFQCLHKNKNLKYKHLQEIAEEKINMDRFNTFYQEFCLFSVGIAFLNWVSCFSKPGRTRSTSFSKFKSFIRKSNFHWSWKSLEWRFSHILWRHFSSLSSCQGERVCK